MNRGPVSGNQKADFVARARIAWGEPPDWVVTLAEEATRTTGAAAARRINYSPATLSQVISNTYRGDLGRVQEMVEGALMASTVDCPVLGEIGRDRCLDEQARPFAATSTHRAQLYHWCAGRCPHSKQHKGDCDE
ncbi:transcriptional regulator [Afifella marina]|uniref:Transcriptional regulator n=1 Tax=Afifella marina DSM 2698 TaxID=1120955 RepID=A0A1G5MGM7_AFIMA|nr:transcriptional regulator [Afifella marina]MBK1625220.1 transcriptional regulator [Afifella marina DSM 2698]MBK1628937.1 transcriptional regulator [Afifella marina]MBK5918316.1 transcriptional regulator [Afifella marina]RAI22835.1 transcriptional regulator [Afifella marina DSM 2698]SCZ23791.1 hypothetical protein SAMN03080610_00604 [Afifella marina DSM 2698]